MRQEFATSQQTVTIIDSREYYSARTRTASRLRMMRKEIRLHKWLIQAMEDRENYFNDHEDSGNYQRYEKVRAARAAVAEFYMGNK